MLYLVTGTPGQGKTLNTIKFVNEDARFKDRVVYQHGIKSLDDSFGWNSMDEEQARKWYDLPTGSVLIFDEAYTIFPTRHGAKQPPKHVQELATHRHSGFDIILICQKVNGQVDPFIRGLVNEHHHYDRIMGSSAVNRFMWSHCCETVNSASTRKDANTKLCTLDKKYFGKYHSADQHTHKANYPKGRIAMFVGAIVVCGFMAYYAYHQLSSRGDQADREAKQIVDQLGGSQEATSKAADNMSYVEAYTPEIKGMPWTAPAYKEIIVPVTYPKPNCLRWSIHGNHDPKQSGCRCYSQQGTLMDVSANICESIVQGGFFDVTKEDGNKNLYNNSGGSSAPRYYPGAKSQKSNRAVFLNDSTGYKARSSSPSSLQDQFKNRT